MDDGDPRDPTRPGARPTVRVRSRVPADQEYFTLPELLSTVSQSVWTELDAAMDGEYTDRKPAISSLRRNLQAEHVSRLIGLAKEHSASVAALRPIATLAAQELRGLEERLVKFLEAGEGKLDSYTKAHAKDIQVRIERFLDAEYVVN